MGHYLRVAKLLTELVENSVFPRKRTRTSESELKIILNNTYKTIFKISKTRVQLGVNYDTKQSRAKDKSVNHKNKKKI